MHNDKPSRLCLRIISDLREEHNSNKIVHFSSWSSLAKARSFFESEQLMEIRRQAGVEEPQFLYLHALEHGTL